MACHGLAAGRHERADTYLRPWTRPAVAGPRSRLERLRLWAGDRQLRKRCCVSAPCRVLMSSGLLQEVHLSPFWLRLSP